jgi:nonsense-mediated mRNA decay protein 3
MYLPARTARNLGNISQLVVVKNISNLIYFIDPLSGQTASMAADVYWRDPIRPIITAARSRMTRFVVLGKEPIVLERNVSKRGATRKQRNRLATLTLAREIDLGVNDQQFEDRSNLGYLMKAGDVCMGYDLTEMQLVDDEAESQRAAGNTPDVIILRKLYGGVATGASNADKMRIWKLQRLDVEVAESTKSARATKNDLEAAGMDEEDFMREVEADRDMRTQMNLYKSDRMKDKKDSAMDVQTEEDDADDDDDDDDQQIKLDELLDGLVLDDGPDQEGAVEAEYAEEEELGMEEGEKAAKDGITYVGREDAREMKEKESAVPLAAFGKEYSATDFKFT